MGNEQAKAADTASVAPEPVADPVATRVDAATQTDEDEGYEVARTGLFCGGPYVKHGAEILDENRWQRCRICCSMCIVNVYYVFVHR